MCVDKCAHLHTMQLTEQRDFFHIHSIKFVLDNIFLALLWLEVFDLNINKNNTEIAPCRQCSPQAKMNYTQKWEEEKRHAGEKRK